MTDDRRPRLGQSTALTARPAFVTVGDDATVPTNVDDYAMWLNQKEKRPGKWFVKEHSDPVTGETVKREIDWLPHAQAERPTYDAVTQDEFERGQAFLRTIGLDHMTTTD